MFTEGEDGPEYVPINSPCVSFAMGWGENVDSLNEYIRRGRTHVLIGQDSESGDYIILRPRENENMDRNLYWNVRNAIDKLKSVYMDLEELPEEAQDIRAMVKRLEGIGRIVDERLKHGGVF